MINFKTYIFIVTARHPWFNINSQYDDYLQVNYPTSPFNFSRQFIKFRRTLPDKIHVGFR